MEHQEKKSQSQSEKPNPYLVPGAILFAGLLIAGTVFLTRDGAFQADVPQPDVPDSPDVVAENDAPEYVIDIEGWPFLGEKDAPVLMVEYSDFACSFCARFWSDTLPVIKEQYIDTGQVKFVYKDLPVVGGDMAAEASHCAAEQGAYWEYHNMLFSRFNQDWPTWNDVEVHRDYANRLGLDSDALVECFRDRRYREKVADSAREARIMGVSGTPHFIINGVSLSGARPFDAFQQAIETALID